MLDRSSGGACRGRLSLPSPDGPSGSVRRRLAPLRLSGAAPSRRAVFVDEVLDVGGSEGRFLVSVAKVVLLLVGPIPLARKKQGPRLVVRERGNASGSAPHPSAGVKSAFAEQLAPRQNLCFQKNVPRNTTPESLGRLSVTQHTIGIPGKCPLRGTKPVGDPGDPVSNARQEGDVHCDDGKS